MSLYDDCMPDRSEYFWEFRNKFEGNFFDEWATGKFCYYTEDDCYALPDTTTKTLLTDLIHKSLSDNHDYVLDWAKKHGKEIVYEEGIVY